MLRTAGTPTAPPDFDPSKRFVWLKQVRPDGFIEFEFAIGEPGLSVDMILPAEAYREFCRLNQVIDITPLQAADIEQERARWSNSA